MTPVIWAAASDSRSTLITGTAPTALASKRRKVPWSSAVCSSSAPCCDRSCLLAVTTALPAVSAASWIVRAGSMPPISSITTSISGSFTRSAKSAVVRTPGGASARRWGESSQTVRNVTSLPVARRISSALSCSRRPTPDPTVP